MRFSVPLFGILALLALASSATAQTPVPDDQAPITFQEHRPAPVFEPAAKQPDGSKTRLDPGFTATGVANSVVNAGGTWSGSLGPWTTGKPDIDKLILDSSQRHGVDPKLVYAVMHQESRFKPRAVSHAGACGYMQLMPGTARRFGVTDIFDPAQNIDAGTRYLRILLDLFNNNVELALAGYNAGEYRVIRNGYRIPAIRETQHYVRTITSRYYGQGGGRRFTVTFGPSSLDSQMIATIKRKAEATTADRADDLVESVGPDGVPMLKSY